jgi:hypothetical protein
MKMCCLGADARAFMLWFHRGRHVILCNVNSLIRVAGFDARCRVIILCVVLVCVSV